MFILTMYSDFEYFEKRYIDKKYYYYLSVEQLCSHIHSDRVLGDETDLLCRLPQHSTGV